jgi:hypothetical protein
LRHSNFGASNVFSKMVSNREKKTLVSKNIFLKIIKYYFISLKKHFKKHFGLLKFDVHVPIIHES